MATYDYTEGEQATTGVKALGFANVHAVHVPKRKFDVPTVIAWNATLTTAAKITSGDIFQLIPVPDDTLVLNGGCKVITVPGCNSIDFGVAGGAELLSAVDLSGVAAGAHSILLVTSSWGADALMGYVFTSADTLDIQFNADATTGEFLFYAICVDVADDVGNE